MNGRREALALRMAGAGVLVTACGTLGTPAGGEANLPSAGVGPFRPFASDEVPGVAPFVLDDRTRNFREPAVVPANPEGSSDAVWMMAVATHDGTDVLVRTRADDGRSFYGNGADVGRTPEIVLRAERPWEGGSLAGPSVVRVDGDWWLYYAAAGGIGLARSRDGVSFEREPNPVFSPIDAADGQGAVPKAPSVAKLEDGTWLLFYSVGPRIAEAQSSDGLRWQRVEGGDFLPTPLEVEVGDPCVAPRVTAAGRMHVRLLYTSTALDGSRSIRFAGRYGRSGPFDRQELPIYSSGDRVGAPALFQGRTTAVLYVQLERATDRNSGYQAIAGGPEASVTDLVPYLDPPDGL